MLNKQVYDYQTAKIINSLLDVLAGRKDPRGLSGEVLINGSPLPKNFKRISGYVVQVYKLFIDKIFVIVAFFLKSLRLKFSLYVYITNLVLLLYLNEELMLFWSVLLLKTVKYFFLVFN